MRCLTKSPQCSSRGGDAAGVKVKREHAPGARCGVKDRHRGRLVRLRVTSLHRRGLEPDRAGEGVPLRLMQVIRAEESL